LERAAAPRLRVCFVCHEYPPSAHGGLGTVTQILASALAAAGHEIRVVGVYRESDSEAAREEAGGVSVTRLNESVLRVGWVADRWRVFRLVSGWAKREEIDLVEVPDWQGWAAGWPRLPVPVIARLHGSAAYIAEEFGRTLRRSAFALERASLRRADAWCATSRYVADVTRRLFALAPGPAEVLHNPVEVPSPAFTGERDGSLVVFAGTLTASKGVVSLLEAWRRVVRERPDARLHVYGRDGTREGGGSMRTWLEEQLDISVWGTVRFCGFMLRSELLHVYEGASVAVFPSFVEAFGLAPLEAMSRACPTVYTRRCSGPEVIENERDGLLVDPARPDEIADAILRLLRDPSLASRIGEAGRRRAQAEFSVDAARVRNEEFFARCVASFREAKRP
jgi:glycosyltransferase involved in cell wall biosynthesis